MLEFSSACSITFFFFSIPWDAPWFDYTVDEGYTEPFPTGVVEKRSELGLFIKYLPSIHWGIEAELYSVNRKNAGNVEGVKDADTMWRVGFWWDGEVQVATNKK